MKVQIRHCFSGPEVLWQKGDVIELPDDEAKRLIAAHAAYAVDESGQKSSSTPANGKK